jgi:hypothetical protein
MTFAEAMDTDAPKSAVAGLSQDDLIKRFAQLDRQVKEQATERREIGLQLAGIAFENKGTQKTVHLESTGGIRLKVEFGIDYEFDNEQMFTAAELLGKEVFDELFKTEIKFTAKKRNLNGFLNTVSSSERTETAKQILREAMKTKDRAPYVSVEKS